MILLSILLVLAYGDAAFFDLSFRWSLVFSILGIAGTVLVFLPGKRTERELHSALAGINFLRFGHPFLRKEAEMDGKRRVQAGHRGQRPGPQAL